MANGDLLLLLPLIPLAVNLIFVGSEPLALNINFGASNSYKDVQGNTWVSDSQIIPRSAGSVATITDYKVLPPYDTLRYFPSGTGDTICQNFPVTRGNKVFFRAFFFYGNYDGKDDPPTFGLWSDGTRWTEVSTDFNHLFVYYANYTYREANFTLCLTRNSTEDSPFINALQVYEGSIPNTYPPFVSPNNGGSGSGNAPAPPPDGGHPVLSPPPPGNTSPPPPDEGQGFAPPPPPPANDGRSSGSTPTTIQHSGSITALYDPASQVAVIFLMLLGMMMGSMPMVVVI